MPILRWEGSLKIRVLHIQWGSTSQSWKPQESGYLLLATHPPSPGETFQPSWYMLSGNLVSQTTKKLEVWAHTAPCWVTRAPALGLSEPVSSSM